MSTELGTTTAAKARAHLTPARAPGASQAASLSFLWPGLGEAYAGRRRAALVWAVPAALLLVGMVVLVVSDPAAAALSLFAPNVATLVVLAIAAHATWRIASIANAWRITQGPQRADRALAVASVLTVTVLVVHLAAGLYVSSVASAGAQIFTAGGGHNIVAPPTPGPNGQLPGDCNGDGVVTGNDILLGDTNGDCVVDGNDDPATDADGQGGDGNGGSDLIGGGILQRLVDPAPAGELPAAGPINVLFAGFDRDAGIDRDMTDTMIVASYFPERGTVTLISVGRGLSRMPLYNGGIYPNRIDSFMGYAKGNPALFPEGNTAALLNELEYFLGTDIPFYAITDFNGFPSAIDTVGGVDVTLTEKLADPYLNFYLDAGVVHLTGANVLPFVRSRHGPNNTDWQRQLRNQAVLEALAKKADSPELLANLPTVLNAISQVVRTNVPSGQVDTLLNILRRANDAATVHVTLESSTYSQRIPPDEVGGRWMWEPVMSGVRDLSLQVFGSYSKYN
jgi:LCP family protein required for cell wall assembly